jgi:hypothetical protein
VLNFNAILLKEIRVPVPLVTRLLFTRSDSGFRRKRRRDEERS